MPKKYTTPPRVSVSAKNTEQKNMLRTIAENDITFVRGTPGSGKTHLAVGYSLQQLLTEHCTQLVFTRPVVEAGGEKLGFLPGNMYEKIDPYMIPIFEILSKLLSAHHLTQLMPKHGNGNGNGNGIQQSPIRILPLAYMRGIAQPLYSKIATPDGWKNMGEIKAGDKVIGSDGQPVNVLNIFPHKKKKIFKICFSDGSYTECCDEHLWLTKTLSEKRHNKPFSVKSTEEISKHIKTNFGQKNHEIPLLSRPIQFNEQNLPVDPYVLGLLLGDGCLTGGTTIKFTTADTELVDYIKDRLPNMQVNYASKYDYRICKSKKDTTNLLKKDIKNLGLLGTKSLTKFVPDIYKYNSIDARIELVRGMLDSDGYITRHRSGNRRITYYTISDYLANDMVEIIQSLGGIAYKRRKKYHATTSKLVNGTHKWIKLDSIKYIWCVDILFEGCNLFRLTRKADVFSCTNSPRPKRLISSVDYVGEMECQCISIDSHDKLYVTDHSILTHNTFQDSFIVADEMQNATPEQIRMILTRLGTGSKMILCGDVYQTDIRAKNGLLDAFELLEGVPGIGFVTLTKDAIMRHPIIQEIEDRYLARNS